jgi:hypothetical protein
MIGLSIWILCAEAHRVPRDAYDPWQAPDKQGRRDHRLRGAGLSPFTQFGRVGYRSLQPPLKDSFRHGSPDGGLC